MREAQLESISPQRSAQLESPGRVYLSPPHIGEAEMRLVGEAIASNWVAPLGPHLDAFERELAAYVGVRYAAALASGTAALHLSLDLAGVKAGDQVLCSTLSFVASATPILYQGASPVFIDVDEHSWNIDPELLELELSEVSRRGKPPEAVVAVDVFGQCADYGRIEPLCSAYGVPLIEDAAEALGAIYKTRKAGSFGKVAVFSFNGNKIITTSGGGMLVSNDGELIERARFLAAQARDPAPHYQHSVVGYNYRMSNILAAIGRGQLQVLNKRIQARRRNFENYRKALDDLPGLDFMPEARYGRSTRWLTCITIDREAFGATREDVRLALERANLESRPVWKPLHLQPVFEGCRVRGGEVAERIFERGLCLPSGSNLEPADQQRVIEIVRACCRNQS